MQEYSWRKSGNLAILRRYGLEIPYNQESVLQTLKNITERRSDYLTQESYDLQIKIYREGVRLFTTEGKNDLPAGIA